MPDGEPMANPLKGEVAFDVEGKSYTLRIDFAAMAKIEGLTEKTFPEFAAQFSDASKIKVSDVILFFWVGLSRHHPDLTRDQAADLMQDMGPIDITVALIAKAMARGQQEAAAKPRPQKPGRRG